MPIVFPTDVGVILQGALSVSILCCLPHGYGGNPMSLTWPSATVTVFPMYVGVILFKFLRHL